MPRSTPNIFTWFPRLIILLGAALGVFRDVNALADGAENEFTIGWAQQSILPGRPVAIAGQYETRISGEVHDPLTVTALAIESQDAGKTVDQLVWVSCDMVGIRRQNVENVRRLVAEAIPQLDVQRIVVSATHTHTAPVLTDTAEADLHPYDFMGSWAYRIPESEADVMHPQQFAAHMENQIAQAVVQAWKSRRTGQFSFALSHASVARNRCAVYFDGTTRMYGDTSDPLFSHTEGTSDDSVDVMFFWEADKLTGLAVTLYCPSQSVEGERYLSADFWDDTRKLLRAKYSDDLFILPLTGASGDQSPHVQVGRPAETNMLQHQQLVYRQEIARRIARAVDDVMDVARATRTQYPRFSHQVALVDLPVWQVPESRFLESRANVQRGQNQTNELTAPEYIRWRVDRTMVARYALQSAEPSYRCEVHAVRLGDFALITNPFELFGDYATRIKARSPAVHTSVIQLTADCAGYLPTERAVQGGGYSARIDDGVVGPEGGRKLVDESANILKQLWVE
jgi:hypothetical protein